MALINHRTHEIHFKIVYYGPGLCGKTTNLRSLHDKLPPERCGKMISIATDQERTLFFDFLPIDLGQVNGFLTRFHLYTVPGQVYYKLSRRAVLQGVDGLVFVADSHPSREAANRESLADLNEHLRTLGLSGPALSRIPWVFQWNKRDLPVTIPIERLKKALNVHNCPEFEAVASTGVGVSETLRAACKAVLARLGTGNAPTATAVAATPGAPVAPVAGAPASAVAPAMSTPMAASVPPATMRPSGALGAPPTRPAIAMPMPGATPAPRPAPAPLPMSRPAVAPAFAPRPMPPASAFAPRPATAPRSTPATPAFAPRPTPAPRPASATSAFAPRPLARPATSVRPAPVASVAPAAPPAAPGPTAFSPPARANVNDAEPAPNSAPVTESTRRE